MQLKVRHLSDRNLRNNFTALQTYIHELYYRKTFSAAECSISGTRPARSTLSSRWPVITLPTTSVANTDVILGAYRIPDNWISGDIQVNFWGSTGSTATGGVVRCAFRWCIQDEDGSTAVTKIANSQDFTVASAANTIEKHTFTNQLECNANDLATFWISRDGGHVNDTFAGSYHVILVELIYIPDSDRV